MVQTVGVIIEVGVLKTSLMPLAYISLSFLFIYGGGGGGMLASDKKTILELKNR